MGTESAIGSSAYPLAYWLAFGLFLLSVPPPPLDCLIGMHSLEHNTTDHDDSTFSGADKPKGKLMSQHHSPSICCDFGKCWCGIHQQMSEIEG